MLCKKAIVPLLTSVGMLSSLPAVADLQEGDVAVKLGGVFVRPNAPSPNVEFDGRKETFKLKKDKDPVTLGLDVLMMADDNIGVNVGTIFPAKVKQKVETAERSGTLEYKLLPLHATLQYYFMTPQDDFRPYIGAGAHYTFIQDLKIGHEKVKKLTLDHEFGFVMQFGGVVSLDQNMFIDMSARYLYLEPGDGKTVYRKPGGGHDKGKIKKLDINPWLFNVSFGMKF